MNGQYTRATFDNHRLYLNLKSGESRILICSDSDDFYPDNIVEERYPKCSSGIDGFLTGDVHSFLRYAQAANNSVKQINNNHSEVLS